MTNILKTYRQNLPASHFIGIKYGDGDRIHGSFGAKWHDWFKSGRFGVLESMITSEYRAAYEDFDASLGLMRCEEGQPFEYWIGMFLPADSPVPAGFEGIDFSSSELGICWVLGKEPDIYCQEEACAKKLQDDGYPIQIDERVGYWCFERYGCPRFTTPNDNGEVILDIGYFI